MAEPNAAPSGWGASAARALRAAGRAFRVSSTVVGAGVLVGSGLAAVVAHDVRKVLVSVAGCPLDLYVWQ